MLWAPPPPPLACAGAVSAQKQVLLFSSAVKEEVALALMKAFTEEKMLNAPEQKRYNLLSEAGRSGGRPELVCSRAGGHVGFKDMNSSQAASFVPPA